MGSWFAHFLSKSGYQIIVMDKNKSAARRLARRHRLQYTEDEATAIKSAQLVVLATPTHVTRSILDSLDKKTPHSKLFVEMSSVKRPLKTTLRKAERLGIQVLSIHPMFGPGTKSVNAKPILTIMPTRRTKWTTAFLSMLHRKGARIIRCNLEEHDKLASIVLTLPHFLNIALANTLRSVGANPKRLSEIAGPTFKLQFLISEAVHHESLENEVSILMDGAYSDAALKEYIRQSTNTLNAITHFRRGVMMQRLREGRVFLQRSGTFESSYRRFNDAVAGSCPD